MLRTSHQRPVSIGARPRPATPRPSSALVQPRRQLRPAIQWPGHSAFIRSNLTVVVLLGVLLELAVVWLVLRVTNSV
jgi:hypothetical protein